MRSVPKTATPLFTVVVAAVVTLTAVVGSADGAKPPAPSHPTGNHLVERCRALGRLPTWGASDLETLAEAALASGSLDPQLAQACAKRTTRAQREALLATLNADARFTFLDSERLALAWQLVPRSSESRRARSVAGLPPSFDDDVSRPLAASVYSLPSTWISPARGRTFLEALLASTSREILVWVDAAAAKAFAGLPRLRLLPTFGRSFSPWPRDPFAFAHRGNRGDGSVTVVLRPNLQRGREEDVNLGRAWIQTLPRDLDRKFRTPTWEIAPVPFHNGQILVTADAAWITLHALEPAILGELGLDRVPVESFGSAEGIDRYLAAAERAASALGSYFGRPVRFVHPLPHSRLDARALPARSDTLRTIGGGAGVDLDSIVTLLPSGSESGSESAARPRALVADLNAGAELLLSLSKEEMASFANGYTLGGTPEALRTQLVAWARQAPLRPFLDGVALHLAAQGFDVARLPLLEIPYAALTNPADLPEGGTFFVGWNNAVLETRNGRVRAEAFESLLRSGDTQARAAYAAFGVDLTLLPTLTESVIRGGGYRCASNHLRAR